MENFPAFSPLCAWNSPITGEFPTQRPVTRSLDVFCDLRMNKRLSKQSWCWWFATPTHSLWRLCNDIQQIPRDMSTARALLCCVMAKDRLILPMFFRFTALVLGQLSDYPSAREATLKIWIKTLNPLRPRRNGRHFADDILKCIFLSENEWILLMTEVCS